MNVKTYKFINLDYMDMITDSDASTKKIMLEMLFEELPQEIVKMTELMEQKDWETLSSVSHKMKSTLAYVGNEEMTAANKELELVSKTAPDARQIKDLIQVLEKLYPMAIEELKEEHSRL